MRGRRRRRGDDHQVEHALLASLPRKVAAHQEDRPGVRRLALSTEAPFYLRLRLARRNSNDEIIETKYNEEERGGRAAAGASDELDVTTVRLGNFEITVIKLYLTEI